MRGFSCRYNGFLFLDFSLPPAWNRSIIKKKKENTFGCIVVVAKEAVVNFPGVTLLLHWWIGWFEILIAADLLPSCPVPSAGGPRDQRGACHRGSGPPVYNRHARIEIKYYLGWREGTYGICEAGPVRAVSIQGREIVSVPVEGFFFVCVFFFTA